MKFKLKIVRANSLVKLPLLSVKRIIGGKSDDKKMTYLEFLSNKMEGQSKY